MSGTGLFAALKRYSPRRDRTPTEEFVGAGLAWLLNADLRYAERVASSLGWIPHGDRGHVIAVGDQAWIDDSEIDLQIVTENLVHWVELKCNSPVRRTQLEGYKYLTCRHPRTGKEVRPSLSLVTIFGHGEADALTGSHRTWTEVHRAMSENRPSTAFSRRLVRDFRSLLREEGFAVADDLTKQKLLAIVGVDHTLQTLRSQLSHALESLERKRGWTYSGRGSSGTSFHVGYLKFDRLQFKPWIYATEEPTEGDVGELPALVVWRSGCRPMQRPPAPWRALPIRKSWRSHGFCAPLLRVLGRATNQSRAIEDALAKLLPRKKR